MNHVEFGRTINKFLSYSNYMLVVYSILTVTNIIICSLISLNGYTKSHLNLSLIIVFGNILNGIYYFLLRKYIKSIFDNSTYDILIKLNIIRMLTYLDVFINIIILLITIILAFLWINGSNTYDDNLLIVETCLISIVSLINIEFIFITIYRLKYTFNPERYNLTENV